MSERKDYPKLVTVGVLHMAQYFPITFAMVALPFLFRKQGLPLEMFWLLALPSMPRWLKWLMALVVDNYGSEAFGRRKSWIVPCTVLATGFYLTLAFIPPELPNVHLMVGILVVAAFVMAAQDIAVDAYAAESMSDAERPVGTVIINFLVAVASVLATASIAFIESYGWSTTMFAAASLLVITALPAMLRTEHPPPEAVRKRMLRNEGPDLIKAVKRQDSRYILPLMFFFGFGQYFFLTMIGPFWADQGMSTTDYGLLSSISLITGSALAALITPALINLTSMRVTAAIGLAVLPIEAVVYSQFATMSELPAFWIIALTVALLSFSTNLMVYSLTISRFRWVSKAQAGTDYSLQSSLWNLGIWAAGSASGFVAGIYGWVPFFWLAALFAMVTGMFYIVGWNRIEQLVVAREQREIADEGELSYEH